MEIFTPRRRVDERQRRAGVVSVVGWNSSIFGKIVSWDRIESSRIVGCIIITNIITRISIKTIIITIKTNITTINYIVIYLGSPTAIRIFIWIKLEIEKLSELEILINNINN